VIPCLLYCIYWSFYSVYRKWSINKKQILNIIKSTMPGHAHCTICSLWVDTTPFLFFFFFEINILYCDCKEYMYYALSTLIMRKGEGVGRRQILAMLRSPGRRGWPGEDRSQRFILHRLFRVKLCQGVCPPPQCTAAGSEQGIAPSCTGSLPW
jgi:hypothetical protein